MIRRWALWRRWPLTDLDARRLDDAVAAAPRQSVELTDGQAGRHEANVRQQLRELALHTGQHLDDTRLYEAEGWQVSE